MKTKLSVIVCALAVSAYGCGSEDGSDGGGGTGGGVDDPTAEAAAAQSIVETNMFEGLKADQEDPTGIAAVSSVYAQLLLTLTPALSSLGGLTEKGGSQSGSITADGDTITFNDFAASGGGASFTLAGSITLTATEITGTLTYTIEAVGTATTLVAVYDVDLDTEGCASGGTLSIDQTIVTLTTSITATFNACDDVTLTL